MAGAAPSPKAQLKQLLAHAHCPISGFAVAATIRCSLAGSEYTFHGVNVEQAEHRLSTHAEEGAIIGAFTALGPDFIIEEAWVLARPRLGAPRVWPNRRPVRCCGKCRQQLVAFAKPETPVHAFSSGGKIFSTTMSALLPDPFELERSFNSPRADPVALIRRDHLSESMAQDWLNLAARPALISGESRGMVLEMSDKTFVIGAAIVDQAFLSVSPAQAAISIAAAHGLPMQIKKYWHTDTPSPAELQVLQPFMQP
jgi:cytidine deaminase